MQAIGASGVWVLAVAAAVGLISAAFARDAGADRESGKGTKASLRLAKVPVLVRDQDAARAFYVERLGMELRTDDAKTMPGFRWLTVSASKEDAVELVLLKATAATEAQLGKGQTLVLSTDDLQKAHRELAARGLSFTQAPSEMPWGWSAMFEDPDGNRFNLVQPRRAP
jgi:predicted enzyme related to lactoylglutathione lyase